MTLLIPQTPAIGIEKHDVTAAQSRALLYCKTNFAGRTYLNTGPDTSTELADQILVPVKGLKHTLHCAMPTLIRASYILPDILQTAELTGKVADKRGRPDIVCIRKYEIELLDGDKPYLALIVGTEQKNGLIHFYDLSFIQR